MEELQEHFVRIEICFHFKFNVPPGLSAKQRVAKRLVRCCRMVQKFETVFKDLGNIKAHFDSVSFVALCECTTFSRFSSKSAMRLQNRAKFK